MELKRLLRDLREGWNQFLPLDERIAAHIAVAEGVAATAEEAGASRLWRGAEGEDTAGWLDEWRMAATGFPALTGGDYLALFTGMAQIKTLRRSFNPHPRLSILGPMEARFLNVDLVILGGMNESVWPPDAGYDPWMSRPMREKFGLPAPEFRIGLSAHDFAQLACAPEVLLTRSVRSSGTPTVPSRFLLQLDAVLRALGYSDDKQDALQPAEPWREWARLLDEPESIAPCSRAGTETAFGGAACCFVGYRNRHLVA